MSELGLTSQIERKILSLSSLLAQGLKAPGCGRHSAHRKGKPIHERFAFNFFNESCMMDASCDDAISVFEQ